MNKSSKDSREAGGIGYEVPKKVREGVVMEKDEHMAEREVVPVEKEVLVARAEEVSVAEAIEQAERRVEIYKKIRAVSLRATTEMDWINHHGQPYLLDDGAKAVARIWGIDLFDIRVEKEWSRDELGDYYLIKAFGKAYSKVLKAYVEDMGICTQRDEFFGRADGDIKPLSMVDEGSVIKAAVTNLRQRLIKALVGLKGITWEELKAAGLSVEKIKEREIKGKAGAVKQKVKQAEFGEAEKKMLSKMEVWLNRLELAGLKKEDVVYSCSKFTGKDGKERGVKRLAEITTDGWVRKVYTNMREIVKVEMPGEE